jgi:hypothetical protein
VSSARYDSLESPSGCLENTRKDIIKDMLAWAAKPDSTLSIFWLAGLAGTGKSTLAKTFCERAGSEGFLVATFFASRNSAERRDPFNIIHTLAYELAVANLQVRAHVLSAISFPPDISQRPMKEQIERLLIEPLTKAQFGDRTTVLVIDALDECAKVDGRTEGGPLISLLSNALRDRGVKLLITSRQEDTLVRLFDSLSHIPLRLHEVESTAVEMDVREIYKQGFIDITSNHPRSPRERPWPSQGELDALVRLTGQFIIFATTSLKYIGAQRFSPRDRLGQILAHEPSLDADAPYARIDALYTDILQAATRDEDGGRTSLVLCRSVGALLRTVVLLEEPLSISALAQIISTSDDQIESDVRSLAAVLLVSAEKVASSASTVRIFHPSFRDYLQDPHRCQDPHFIVNPEEHQRQLLHRCLTILNQDLRQDICEIRNPGLANAEISDLAIRLQRSVSDALRYAAVFWLVHIAACRRPSELLCETLLEFCERRLLQWIELLSLLDRTSFALMHLPSTVAWCQVKNQCDDLD